MLYIKTVQDKKSSTQKFQSLNAYISNKERLSINELSVHFKKMKRSYRTNLNKIRGNNKHKRLNKKRGKKPNWFFEQVNK